MLKCPECYSDSVVRHSYSCSGKQRYSCKSCGHRTVNPIGLDHIDDSIDRNVVSDNIRNLKQWNRWAVTSAQNATPVNKAFLESLKVYCEYTNSKLLVIPYRYRNATSIFTDKDHEWWDSSIVPYLIDQRVALCRGLTLLADIKVQPTASTPLSGLEGFTGGDSCIVGHPKYQMSTVPTRQGHMAKIMTTTGSCTVENYTASKAGKKGIHHHSFGAVVVEEDGDVFHIRHIASDSNGVFQDLDRLYTPIGVENGPPIESLTLGDLHQWWVDKDVDTALFGETGVVNTLKPKRLILHDCVDSYSISPHHVKDPFIKYAKYKYNRNSIQQEIEDFVSYIHSKDIDAEIYAVSSNHDDHISRWVKESDWKDDPANSEFYLKTALYMVQNAKMHCWGDEIPKPLKFWVEQLSNKITVLDRDESLEVCGVEHGMHGDKGPNGSRGSAQSLSRVAVKSTVGHVHSPSIKDGCYAVGTCAPKMAYAVGPSSWLSSHCVLYSNGKRTLINTINGRWKA